MCSALDLISTAGMLIGDDQPLAMNTIDFVEKRIIDPSISSSDPKQTTKIDGSNNFITAFTFIVNGISEAVRAVIHSAIYLYHDRVRFSDVGFTWNPNAQLSMYVNTKEKGRKTLNFDLSRQVNEGVVQLQLSKFFANIEGKTPEQLSKEDLSVIDSLKLPLTLGLQMLQKGFRSLAASLLSMLRQDVNLKFQ